MTLKDFYKILTKIKLPVAYHHFEEGRTLKKDLEIETKMDDLFDSHSIFFDKVETYISTEKLYQITYYISLKGG